MGVCCVCGLFVWILFIYLVNFLYDLIIVLQIYKIRLIVNNLLYAHLKYTCGWKLVYYYYYTQKDLFVDSFAK